MSQIEEAVQEVQKKLPEVVVPKLEEIGRYIAELHATLPASSGALATLEADEKEDTLSAVRGYLECLMLEVIPGAIQSAMAAANYRPKRKT
jgi:hypothetical protein